MPCKTVETLFRLAVQIEVVLASLKYLTIKNRQLIRYLAPIKIRLMRRIFLLFSFLHSFFPSSVCKPIL